MSGDGCGGGGHCGGHGDFGGVGGGTDSWGPPADLAAPKLVRLEINGAPVIDQSHEYVLSARPGASSPELTKGDLR